MDIEGVETYKNCVDNLVQPIEVELENNSGNQFLLDNLILPKFDFEHEA